MLPLDRFEGRIPLQPSRNETVTNIPRQRATAVLFGAAVILSTSLSARQQPAAPPTGQPAQAPQAAPAAQGPTGFTASPTVKFRAQEIAADFGVGYAVTSGDVNGDKLVDILAISGTELVWFKAPTWEKTVILAAGATTADNVTLAPHD